MYSPPFFLRSAVAVLFACGCATRAAEPVPVATKPPMGWNSWDCFATTVTEAQTKAQTDVMADKLARFGWTYVTVDIQWYEPSAKSFDYRKDAPLVMDEFGRLLPASNRFPAGFKKLAEYVHSKGLKFGIHLLRGIPRQAVERNLPVKGSGARAAEIADKASVCPWNGDMYGVDMTKPGAQDYYNSVFELVASWDVDFVKVDDLSRPYHAAEIEGIRRAIGRTGHPMVFSLSPGETPLAQADHVVRYANMWRMSDDFWDSWKALLEQFERCKNWAPFAGPGHFPDADMLPLGIIRFKERTRFTPEEQKTMLTLWCIARSPLIFGGDLTKLDPETAALITNAEVLAVDQDSSSNRQLFRRDGLVAWIADAAQTGDKYLAVFNTRDGAEAEVALNWDELGWKGSARVRDLWRQADVGKFDRTFVPKIPAHGAALYRFSPVH